MTRHCLFIKRLSFNKDENVAVVLLTYYYLLFAHSLSITALMSTNYSFQTKKVQALAKTLLYKITKKPN